MDSRKASEWGQIISTIFGGAVLAFAIWDHWPNTQQPTAEVAAWSTFMRAWLPPAVIAAIMLCAAVLNVFASRHKQRESSDSNLLNRFSGKRQQVKSLQQDVARAGASLVAERKKIEALESDYKLARTQINNLKEELAEANSNNLKLNNELAAAQEDAGEWQRSYHDVNNSVTPIKNLNENYEGQIAKVKTENQNLRDQLDLAKRGLENANLKINEETGQRDQFMKMYYEKEAKLNSLNWLHELATEQAKNISNHVVINFLASPIGEIATTGTHLGVYVYLRIRNESVFNLAIKPENVTGRFSLHNVPFKEKAGQLIDDYRPPIHNLKPGEYETLIIEQPLREFETEIIGRSAETDEFWIGNMQIPVSINNDGFQDVDPRPLRLTTDRLAIKLFKRNTDNA